MQNVALKLSSRHKHWFTKVKQRWARTWMGDRREYRKPLTFAGYRLTVLRRAFDLCARGCSSNPDTRRLKSNYFYTAAL